jgi:hypothetical protein
MFAHHLPSMLHDALMGASSLWPIYVFNHVHTIIMVKTCLKISWTKQSSYQFWYLLYLDYLHCWNLKSIVKIWPCLIFLEIWWIRPGLFFSTWKNPLYVQIVGYQFPTKLLKLFLPNYYYYLRHLCYIHILLGLWNMLSKFT